MEECIQSSAEIPDRALSDELKAWFATKVKNHVKMVLLHGQLTFFIVKVTTQATNTTVDCVFTMLLVLGLCLVMSNSWSYYLCTDLEG